MFFATDTFLRGYARMANPYDFHSVRIVGAGAERVSDETRRVYAERFGVRILEGYGATETAPVIAFNTPMHFKAGTVGRLMPGIEHRLDPVTASPGFLWRPDERSQLDPRDVIDSHPCQPRPAHTRRDPGSGRRSQRSGRRRGMSRLARRRVWAVWGWVAG